MKDHDLVERDGLEVNQPQTNRGRVFFWILSLGNM